MKIINEINNIVIYINKCLIWPQKIAGIICKQREKGSQKKEKYAFSAYSGGRKKASNRAYLRQNRRRIRRTKYFRRRFSFRSAF